MNRQDIRKQVLAWRRQMEPEELERLGNLIASKILQSEWYQQAHCVHCFYGVTAKGEIPTVQIIQHAIDAGKVLAMPKVTDSEGGMIHTRVEDPGLLQPGPWGIPEPAGTEEVPVEDIDLILVPGLAADCSGNRIGYGKGYYDRFLGQARRAVKVMLVPEKFIFDQIPAEDHDVPVDLIVTDKRIHTCD